MAQELSLDYIGYLEEKWKKHLRKTYDARDAHKRRAYEDICDTIDDMKNQTKVGIMLYDVFYMNCSRAKGELRAYAAYLRNQNNKK